MESRIYVDGKLVNICYNEYALMNNYASYLQKYGTERVVVKNLDVPINDKEKREWLNDLV